ncbi:MAG: ABC transporter permease [Hungatella sp.]|nr:ABC transporter permease [Hungatella sp.]
MNEPSMSQKEFVFKEKLHKSQVQICRVMLLVLLLAVWELCAELGIIDSFIFSSPTRIWKCFGKMAGDGSIFLHIGVTLLETLVSFFLVVVIGVAAAVALWASRSLSEVLEPYLVMLNSLPKSALAPLLIVWLGNNMRTIIVAAVSVAVFGSILTLHTGFMQTDQDKIRLIQSLGGTKRDVLTKVLIPSSVPLIISNMKVNVGLCLVGVIIGEFLSAKAGLGYLIIYASQVFSCEYRLTGNHMPPRLRASVTVQVGLCACRTDRVINWAREQKSHRRRRFSWIFASCCERV